jgi:hypothetical protein
MTPAARARLRQLNDPLLWPMIEAVEESAREAAIESVVTGFVKSLIDTMIARFRKVESTLRMEDLEELSSIVVLRLMRKLRAASLFEEHAIASLEDYVATLSFHALYDLRRQRHPERHRLKKNLRYLLTRDPRFALWETTAAIVCGPASWKGRSDAMASPSLSRHSSTPEMEDRENPGDAVAAIFKRIGAPVKLDTLVDLVAELWHVRDVVLESVDSPPDEQRDPLSALEQRQYLERLWSEIRQLPENQRAALLLNLRDSAGNNALVLFLLLEIARAGEVAAAMGMSEQELNEVWERLPLDDLTIASRLNIGRQQVINLRSAARSRLERRMSRRK